MLRLVKSPTRAQLDCAAEDVDSLALRVETGLQRLRHVLADLHLIEPLQVGQTIEIQDVRDQRLSVLHFVEAERSKPIPKPPETPVGAHFGRKKVLVDGRELDREVLVEQVDDTLSGSHPTTVPGEEAAGPRLRAAPREASATKASMCLVQRPQQRGWSRPSTATRRSGLSTPA